MKVMPPRTVKAPVTSAQSVSETIAMILTSMAALPGDGWSAQILTATNGCMRIVPQEMMVFMFAHVVLHSYRQMYHCHMHMIIWIVNHSFLLLFCVQASSQ